MALGDIKVSWVNPTKTVGGAPVVLTKVRIYEMPPGATAPIVAREITDAPTMTAQTVTLVDYYVTARAYSMAVSFFNADGESALSPFGSDSVDVPAAGGSPSVAISPK